MFARLFVLLTFVLAPTIALAQSSPKIAVVNFERAVVESVEGKKASDRFNAQFEEHRKKIEAKQKELEDMETRLRTQERALSETARADLTRNIQRGQTDLTRLNEDAQRELGTSREELLRPISDIAGKILEAYAAEQAYTVIFDLSNPQTNIVYASDALDVTAELIRRIDTVMTQTPAAAQPARPAAPAQPPRPATPAPPRPQP
jgi:Skp family chaperone for outer membrane proteins